MQKRLKSVSNVCSPGAQTLEALLGGNGDDGGVAKHSRRPSN